MTETPDSPITSAEAEQALLKAIKSTADMAAYSAGRGSNPQPYGQAAKDLAEAYELVRGT